MIRILIIGLGSIGQRHAEALLAIGVIEIAALRTNKGQKQLDTSLDLIKMFIDEQKAFDWKPTHLIISNPTSLHMQYVKIAIDKGIKFLVEKPISDSLKEIGFINDFNSINGVVGYNLRFHGLFSFVKRLIDNNAYGRVITAQLHVGQYLPNWHPYEDYRDAYYAKKELGGGGLRTLSHEIDLMQYFFGNVQYIFAKVETNSNLEIDVDDVTNIIASTEQCSQVQIHINLLDPNVKREGRIYFTEGVLEYDFMKSKITFTSNKGKESVIYSQKENINTQYQNQMKEFVGIEKSKFACSFTQGINVMQIIEKCEESNNQKREICLI